MFPRADKQTQIDHLRQEVSNGYPELWSRITTEWNSPDPKDRAWLMYSANYLFRTGGMRWALDPLTLRRRVPSAPRVDLSVLSALDFIVLTHRHADHLDFDLLRAMRDHPIRYIIPESILPIVQKEVDLPADNVVVAGPGRSVDMGGVLFTPFDGFHWEHDDSHPGGRRGVPETGYLVEFSGKRWLFPGDTRTYDATLLPHFGPVDGLFAHLWLGRGRALREEPQLLDRFCQFCQDLQPKRIIITHLEEFGRSADDYWDVEHFQQVKRLLRERTPDILVESAILGEDVDL